MKLETMDRDRILLKGYYGFGNFGDDVLMVAAWQFLNDIFPQADIQILCNSPFNTYIDKMLDDSKVVNQPEGKYDLIFHGGGGVFFDFNEGSSLDRLINETIKLSPSQILKRIKTLRRFKKIAIEETKIRVGVGIGVGTFTKSSVKFRTSITFLREFDRLYVRDQTSVNNYEEFTKSDKAALSTDLAFASNFWIKKKHQFEKSRKIGFVVRSWGLNNVNGELLIQARHLKSAGFDVVIFLFDKNQDVSLIEEWSEFELNVWDPSSKSLDQYLDQLSKLSLVVTARAHGAIICSILGIPSIIIEIEPKLSAIAKMLPNGSVLLKDINRMKDQCELMFDNLESYRDMIMNDVNKNQKKIEDDLNNVREYLLSEIR